MFVRLKEWARQIVRDVITIWLIGHDRRTPLIAKAVAVVVAAYALSPIDLIPDFIPVLGLLDDILIVPAGIVLALRLTPPALVSQLRQKAAAMPRPVSRNAMVVIVAIWALAVIGTAFLFWP